jgi:hypothetical protein
VKYARIPTATTTSGRSTSCLRRSRQRDMNDGKATS